MISDVITGPTIYALSTPPGKSGVAVIRVSGMQTREALKALGVAALPAPRKAALCALSTPGDLPIDRALVLYFPAPASFTGEDVAEFHVHGGRSVIRCVMDVLARVSGLRLAEPGEFMRRAFLNGKMDLTAAEGLADLIDAETETQRRQALQLMQGDAARFFDGLRAGILHSLAYLEAYIDFPDEEIPEHVLSDIQNELMSLSQKIRHELDRARVGRTIREGVRIAIVGPPNAGKSSLLNHFAQREMAIVSPLAGTTRDVLEAHLDLKGYSVTFADTAGIREFGDIIEQEGIRRSLMEVDQADIKILLLDSSEMADFRQLESNLRLMDERTILVFNKADLAPLPPSFREQNVFSPILISIRNKQGIDAVLDAIEKKMEMFFPVEPVYVTRQRHQQHLEAALSHIDIYLQSTDLPLELKCEELRVAALEIGKITGKIAVDELLGHIFSSFCIGK